MKTHQALIDEASNRGYLYYPLVFIDNELKLAGSAEYYEVLYLVREALGEGKAEAK
jgi:hypothetical protein